MPTIIVMDVKNSKMSDFMNTRFGNMIESASSFAREFTKRHFKCLVGDEILKHIDLLKDYVTTLPKDVVSKITPMFY